MLKPSGVIDAVERERRILIYRRATPLFGTIQPAAVLNDAERFGHILHHFAEGIFKPQWATYAFSISSMLTSPYTDQIDYLPDRSWTMAYSPKSGGLDVAANRALIACMEKRSKRKRRTLSGKMYWARMIRETVWPFRARLTGHLTAVSLQSRLSTS